MHEKPDGAHVKLVAEHNDGGGLVEGDTLISSAIFKRDGRNVLLLAVDESPSQGYQFQLRGLDLAAGPPVTGAVDFVTGRLVLDNLAGGDGAYDLEARRSNANGQWSFFHPGVPLLATDKHYLDYDAWDGVGDLTLLADHGGEGTIVATVPLANQGYRLYLPLVKR